jgi:hypothetical protein
MEHKTSAARQLHILKVLGWIDLGFVIWGLFAGTVLSRAVLSPMHQQASELFLSATPSFPLYYGLFTAISVISLCMLAAGARLMMRGTERGLHLHRVALTIALLTPLALLVVRAHTGFTPGGRGDGEGYALLPLAPQFITLWPLIGLLCTARIHPRPHIAAACATALAAIALSASAILLTQHQRDHAYAITLERTDVIHAFTEVEYSAWRSQLALLPNSFYGAGATTEISAFAAYCREQMSAEDLDQAAAATVHLAALISRVALLVETHGTDTPRPPAPPEPTASLRALGAYLAIAPFWNPDSDRPTAPQTGLHLDTPPETYLLPTRPHFLDAFETAVDWKTITNAFQHALTRDRSLMPLQRDIHRALSSYNLELEAHASMRACVATLVQLEIIKRKIVDIATTPLPHYLSPAEKTQFQTHQLALPDGGNCPLGAPIDPGPYGQLPTCPNHGMLSATHIK